MHVEVHEWQESAKSALGLPRQFCAESDVRFKPILTNVAVLMNGSFALI